MKKSLKRIGLLLLVVAVAAVINRYVKERNSAWHKIKDPATVAQLKQFIALKEAQAHASTNGVLPDIQALFKYAERGDWLAFSNSYSKLERRHQYWDSRGSYCCEDTSGLPAFDMVCVFLNNWVSPVALKYGWEWDRLRPPKLEGTPWIVAGEIHEAFKAFLAGDENYSRQFGRDIIDSIPAGSVYFGGTDAGRFIVTAMSTSHLKGDPIFTLAQNALGDKAYLDYLRAMYGSKIYTPTENDWQKAFEDYSGDVERRLAAGQMEPGEVANSSGGRVQVSGQVSVMKINSLLAKVIIENTTNREFYIEESFPLDWMYPYEEPHGLIFKLVRQPMAQLPEEVVRQDHEFWSNYVKPMIGDWLEDKTSVTEIAAFAEKTFQRHDFTGFTGDTNFVQNAPSQRMYSKLRSSIGGLYYWRFKHTTDATNKERMRREADLAFRQAWALAPESPEAVYRYINLLLGESRLADAATVCNTAINITHAQGGDAAQLHALLTQLQKMEINGSPATDP